MSETIIVTLISAGVSLFTSICYHRAEGKKARDNYKIRKQESKKEKLSEIYTNLIRIINLYPDISPNDILERIEYAPCYSMEHFDFVMKSLDYQIEDYRRELGDANINFA